MIAKKSWLIYADLPGFAKGEFRPKARNKLEKEGCIWHLFTYVQIAERFELDKMKFVFTGKKAGLWERGGGEDVLVTNILLLKLQIVIERQSWRWICEDCMIKWVKWEVHIPKPLQSLATICNC